jgi:hypothetical protein
MLPKAEIEAKLKDLLNDCLSSANQDGSIISLELDESGETCTVKMNVTIVEEDDYIGFEGY